MVQSEIRQYEVRAESSTVFGRVLCGARNHHLVVDGPQQNGCPGEEVTPAELFLAGVACCGVELIQVLAKSAEIPLKSVNVGIVGMQDRSRPVRNDISLFNSVRLKFRFTGINQQQASQLIDSFKGR
jgi:uncharacterized OsmC-like protein